MGLRLLNMQGDGGSAVKSTESAFLKRMPGLWFGRGGLSTATAGMVLRVLSKHLCDFQPSSAAGDSQPQFQNAA